MQQAADRAATPATVRLSEYVAQQTSRRVFLRRTLTGAFAFGASAALANLTKPAYADALCGPQLTSPYCTSGKCSSSRQDCSSGAGCRRRRYGSLTACVGWTTANCWVNRYQDTRWLCCDCCCPGGSGRVCTGCTGRRACVCRFRLN
jgi:hypothetical protein